ncbi:MAG: Zn-ribbon domain-containing OB-fold protein [archaeon]
MSVSRTWRAIPEHYNLTGVSCTACGQHHFPHRDVCRSCGDTVLRPHRFEGKGKIVTFTIIRTQGTGDTDTAEIPARDVPYILAVIELDEGPKLTAQIVDCDETDVAIGQRVDMVFRKIMERGVQGVIHYGYKFRLV